MTDAEDLAVLIATVKTEIEFIKKDHVAYDRIVAGFQHDFTWIREAITKIALDIELGNQMIRERAADISELAERVDKHEERISSLERSRETWKTVFSGLSMMFTAAGAFFAWVISKLVDHMQWQAPWK